jgi:glycosyltransferase involved in cell wall biosynthesis
VWLFLAANLIGLAGLIVELLNLREFPLVRDAPAPEPVDVIVAMRDEAERAAACVRAALDAPNVARVVVLNDGSTDATLEALAAVRDPRLHVLDRDCGGKRAALAYAVANGGAASAWLLFVDADVRLTPAAPGALVAHARARGADAVTVWPRVLAPSVWSSLLAPYLTFFLLQALPMRAARGTDPRFAAGNGACFLVRRDAYDLCGGHAALDAVVEDVALARALKRNGARVALGSGAELATIDGYESFAQNVRGYGRSLYFGAGVPGCAAFALWQALLAIAPLPLYAGRAVAAARMRESWWPVVLAPLASALAALGALLAALEGATGRIVWRGRTLRPGESPPAS